MSTDSICYLHLSDFHSGKDDYAQRKLFNKIVEHIKGKLDKGSIPDFVFITGDIANEGSQDEYKLFNDEFLLELEIALGDAWEGKIFIVPGNHDVNQQLVKYLDRDAMHKSGTKAFDPTKEGKSERKILIEGTKDYQDCISSHAPSGWLSSEAGAYAVPIEINGQKIGIVGINTAWLSKDKHDRHNLTAGVNLLDDALKSLPEECVVKIVLGHHPLDWFKDSEIKRIRVILGNNRAIYLHGHLHEAWALPEMNSAGQGYLCIQTGACFQSRDDEQWRNGVLWGEIDISKNQLRLQPCHWLPDHGAWGVNGDALHPDRKVGETDWWAYPLPGSGAYDMSPAISATTSTQGFSIPSGWEEITKDKLDQRRKDPNLDTIIRFFDGSIPNWSIALHSEIPRRTIVSRLSAHLIDYEADSPQVIVLLGAGGEGKSTAFLQSIERVVNIDTSWRVLWRYGDSSELSEEDFLALPVTGHPWLIASDDAEQLFPGKGKKTIYDIVVALRREGRSDVRILLACRDTDWRSCGANTLNWRSTADFKTEELNGLSAEDADAIGQAWITYGQRGLGQLAGKEKKEIVQLLLEAAKKESETEDGAFLGAMLKVRIGDALKDHVLIVLQRLEKIKIHERGTTLLDAFAYIAAMHSEKQMFLSQQVLGEILACPPNELRRKVIYPLGMEAAATGAGGYIFTRHRAIAITANKQLTDVFGYDLDELLVEMAGAAIAMRVRGEFVPNLHNWNYDFPHHFLNNDRKNIAIRIARKMCEKNPLEPLLLNNLAKIYRGAGEPELAVQVFRDSFGTVTSHRSSYYEWGTAEGLAGNQCISAFLDAISLADQSAASPPDNKQAKYSLNGFGEACKELFGQFHDSIYLLARSAVAQMALHLDLDERAQRDFKKHLLESQSAGVQNMDIDAAMTVFQKAVKAAWLLCGGEKGELSARFTPPEEMTYKGLKTLILNAANRRANTV